LQALAQEPGSKTVVRTAGDGDFSPGPVRFSFLVVTKDGRVITAPTADVWIARGFKQKPYQRTTARLETVGVPGASEPGLDAPAIYVTHVRAPRPGTYWLLAKPKGTKISGLGNIQVRPRSTSPAVGAKAPRSRTPTLTTTHGRLAPLTTSAKPDRALRADTVAQALAARDPFVVTFATPKFCSSRTCGPNVDVVSAVRKKASSKGVRFIHVEIYREYQPDNVVINQAAADWLLRNDDLTEPWIYLIGADGTIQDRWAVLFRPDDLESQLKALPKLDR